MELQAAITRPLEPDDWYVPLLLGGALLLLWFLVVPLVVVYGYLVRVMRSRFEDEPEAPPFAGWSGLVLSGLRFWVISVLYLVVPLAVGGATISGVLSAFASGTEVGVMLGLVGLVFGGGLTVLLTLVFGYLAIAGIVHSVYTGRFGAAFAFGSLRPILFSRAYVIAWVLSFVLLVLVAIVIAIPIVGWLLGPFVLFYALVVSAELWAEGYLASREPPEDAEVTP